MSAPFGENVKVLPSGRVRYLARDRQRVADAGRDLPEIEVCFPLAELYGVA